MFRRAAEKKLTASEKRRARRRLITGKKNEQRLFKNRPPSLVSCHTNETSGRVFFSALSKTDSLSSVPEYFLRQVRHDLAATLCDTDISSIHSLPELHLPFKKQRITKEEALIAEPTTHTIKNSDPNSSSSIAINGSSSSSAKKDALNTDYEGLAHKFIYGDLRTDHLITNSFMGSPETNCDSDSDSDTSSSTF